MKVKAENQRIYIWDDEAEEVGEYLDENGETVIEVQGAWYAPTPEELEQLVHLGIVQAEAVAAALQADAAAAQAAQQVVRHKRRVVYGR